MYIIEFCLPDFIKINQLFLFLLYFTFSTHHRIFSAKFNGISIKTIAYDTGWKKGYIVRRKD